MPCGPLPSGISNVCIEPSRVALTMVLSFWPVIQKRLTVRVGDQLVGRAGARPVGNAVGRVLDRELLDPRRTYGGIVAGRGRVRRRVGR